MEAVVTVMSVLAFGIAAGTLAYNVHEFRLISKEFREGNERIVRVLERIERRMDSSERRAEERHRALMRAVKTSG